jgi:branched-chain amino acid transport system permease protein
MLPPSRTVHRFRPGYDMLAQQIVNGIVLGSVYALFALGFTLVFGVLNVLNLAHGAVFMWGGYAGLYAVTGLNLPLPLAILAAMVAGGILSVLVDLVAFRPLRNREGSDFSAIISSIGASLILLSIAQQMSKTQVTRFPFDTFPIHLIELAGLRISTLQLLIIGALLAVVLFLLVWLHGTSAGRQLRAVALSARTASLLGVNPDVVYLQTFFIAGGLAAAGGVLIGLAYNSVHFLMGEPFMLRAFVVIVAGGLGSVTGAVVAGVLLGLVQTLSVAYFSSSLADVLIFSLLFVLLLLRPQGMFPGLHSVPSVGRK